MGSFASLLSILPSDVSLGAVRTATTEPTAAIRVVSWQAINNGVDVHCGAVSLPAASECNVASDVAFGN